MDSIRRGFEGWLEVKGLVYRGETRRESTRLEEVLAAGSSLVFEHVLIDKMID